MKAAGKRRLGSGQAFLELALCLPLLLLTALGGLQLALLAEARLLTAVAAHQVARSLSVRATAGTISAGLPQGKEVAALTLAGITPRPPGGSDITALPEIGIPPGHAARLRQARALLQLELQAPLRGTGGWELALRLTYDYPLVIPLANRLLWQFCPERKSSRPFPYLCPLRAVGVTRFGSSSV